MPPVPAKLVTIITIFTAERRVLDALHELGVRGFSVTHVRGEGVHGAQRWGLIDSDNVAFTVVTTSALAAQILGWVEARLVPDYPGIAYSADVMAVLQPPGGPPPPDRLP